MAVHIKCDIIICGAGMAGLSLLYRALKSGIWNDLNIIVIDRSAKTMNDKTWSFWKSGTSEFDEIIYHQWKELVFFTNDNKRIPLNSHGYTYNSIHSIDFYRHVLQFIHQFSNVSFVYEEINKVYSSGEKCMVDTITNTYHSSYLFNSIYNKPLLKNGEQYFLQHFKGWRIKTEEPVLPVNEAYLMDFRTGQGQGTTFFYTLPMATDEIFVEYTLFSKSLLSAQEYDVQLKKYITGILSIEKYTVLEEEFGAIPMTDHLFNRFDRNIVYIGTAGGDTRGSTGYTFTNTQKTVGNIIGAWKSQGNPFFSSENIGLKHQLYDATLLNVLDRRSYEGHQVFSDLFSNTSAYRIFKFLDAESSVFQDFFIMKSLKVAPFLQSFIQAVKRRLLS